MTPLVLTYSHNVIEHLGLKLYQNRPTRVIAELVSNAWDADSPLVWIDLNMAGDSERWIAVHDCGHGMTRDALAYRFLVIGAPKRFQPDEETQKGRRLMGRKGIGKLAPFGIAGIVEVVTASVVGGKQSIMWLKLDLKKIKSSAKPGETARYEPGIVLDNGTADEARQRDDPSGQVAVFLDRLKEAGSESGTLVLLRSLTIHRAIPAESLIESLGRRFTTTTKSGFEVIVDGRLVDTNASLPDFEFRIPEVGITTECLPNEREVRFWVGFVKSASWPQDEAGVGIYSHGKICQDRPFAFGVKGREIFTRYMYAVVEADWLDELAEDLISTDRTTINWDSDEVKELHDWGVRRVGQWVGKFEAWRRTLEKDANRQRLRRGIQENNLLPMTEEEQEQVSELLSKVSPTLGKDEDAKDRLASAVAAAWRQEPMRELVKQLWSEIGQDDASAPQVFSGLIERLVSYSVPESLNLAVVFAQRAFALTKLYDYVHNGQEVELQKLLQEFPWIIEPDSMYLTANQPLKTVVETAEREGLIPTGRRHNVAGVPEANKPDFVFLSSPDEKRIVVVELKNPQVDLTIENREQLGDYLTFLEAHYPNAELRGYLVGRAPSGLKMARNDTEVLPWTAVLQRSRSRYVVFLAAMLASIPNSGDVSVDSVRDFAGDEVWDLLRRLASTNQRLSGLLSKYGAS